MICSWRALRIFFSIVAREFHLGGERRKSFICFHESRVRAKAEKKFSEKFVIKNQLRKVSLALSKKGKASSTPEKDISMRVRVGVRKQG